jgi:hypothetical protein
MTAGAMCFILKAMGFRAVPATLAATILLWAAQARPAGPLRFPALTADTLSKQTLHMPGDFSGDHNLVLIAFDRGQQKDLDTWAAPEESLAKTNASFRFYDVPVLPRRDVLYRWWLNTAMRAGISDDKARKRTVPLYVSKEPFKKALEINNETAITALLLDKQGQVRWRSSGAWTEEKQRALVYAMGHE